MLVDVVGEGCSAAELRVCPLIWMAVFPVDAQSSVEARKRFIKVLRGVLFCETREANPEDCLRECPFARKLRFRKDGKSRPTMCDRASALMRRITNLLGIRPS